LCDLASGTNSACIGEVYPPTWWISTIESKEDAMDENLTFVVMQDGTMITDEKGEVYDLLQFALLEVQVHVKEAANSGETLQLQHSAVDVDDAYVDLGSTFDIATTGNKIASQGEFLRFIRFKASTNITTQPTLSIVVVAKTG